MFKRIFAPLILVAMAATGCAEPMARGFGSDVVVAPDGTGRWTRGSIVQAEGSQIVRSADEMCDPVKDADGKTVGWVTCREVSHPAGTTAMGDNSPGAKAANAIADVGGKAVLAGGMVGAAAVLKPAVTEILQSGGGASATTGSATATTGASTATTGAVTQTGGGATANSGSLTTGTVTGGSTVSGPNVGQ